MKTTTSLEILKLIILICCFPVTGNAQTISYTPGPANIDTTKFAHVYFLRDKPDEFPDSWLGVIMNDDEGLCVKAKINSVYRVNTLHMGETRFWTNIQNKKEEIILNLSPGKNYYVQLNPIRMDDKSIVGKLMILDEAEGTDRVKSFNHNIQQRYCILPYKQGNHDFRENSWKDTIGWYASSKYKYFFNPLPSWELILRSPQHSSFGFRNEMISNTYSETGGILYQPLTKCDSAIEFANYCKNKFPKSTLIKQKDSLVNMEVKPVNIPPGIKYANIVSIENSTVTNQLPDDKSLLMRSTYVVFFWTDQKGKGNTACLYLSERGLPEELHSMSILEERILWSWKRFMLLKK